MVMRNNSSWNKGMLAIMWIFGGVGIFWQSVSHALVSKQKLHKLQKSSLILWQGEALQSQNEIFCPMIDYT